MKLLTFAFIVILVSCSNSDEKRKTTDSLIASKYYNNLPRIISDFTNILEDSIQTLELEYIDWSCACANWITAEDRKKYQDTGKLSKHCIFIEPSDSSLNLPDNFDWHKERIRITGQFYKREDYPKGTIETEEHLDKAKVFRYTKIKIIKENRI